MDYQDPSVVTLEQPIQSYNIEIVLGLLLKNPEVINYLFSVDFNENVPLWRAMFDAAEEIVETLKGAEVDADVNLFLKLMWEKIYCQNTSAEISERSIQPKKIEKVLGLLLKIEEIPSIILSSDFQDSSIWEKIIEGSKELSELIDEFDVDVDTWCVVDETTQNKTTFLHWFASLDDWESKIRITEALIKIGADINAENDDNVRPLEIAVRKGNLDCIEFLLFNDASLSPKSIIDLLLKNPELQGRKEMLNLLIKYDVNLLDDFWASEGENLLQFILNLENDYDYVMEVAKIIIEAGAIIEDECENTSVMLNLSY